MNTCSDLHQHQTGHYSSWSDLPLELLTLILTRLESEEDIRNSRLVCKSWNTSVLSSNIIPTVPSLPMSFSNPTTRKLVTSLLFPPNTPLIYYPKSMKKPLSIFTYHVYILRRNVDGYRWLVGIEQSKPGKLVLVHPLTRVPLKYLLPVKFPKLLSDFCPLRISTGYELRLCNEHVVKNGKLAKVIYWENPYKSSSDDVQDVSLMVLYYSGMLKCLSLMRNNNILFTEIIYRETKFFDDIMKWNDKILAVDKYGRLHEIEYKTMSVTTILAASSNVTDSTIGRKRLLEWNGQLYLVVQRKYSRSIMSSVDIGVYVLNTGSGLWEKLISLGDRILFMSSDDCFFVDSNDLLPGQGFGNCLVFSKGCFDSMRYDHPYSQDRNLFKKNPGYLQVVGVREYNNYPNFRLLSSNSTLSTAFWPPHWVFKSGDEGRTYG